MTSVSFTKIGAVILLSGINECSTSTFQISWPILIKFNTEDIKVWSVLSFERIDTVRAILYMWSHIKLWPVFYILVNLYKINYRRCPQKLSVSLENWRSGSHNWHKDVTEFLSHLGKILCKRSAIWLLNFCEFRK